MLYICIHEFKLILIMIILMMHDIFLSLVKLCEQLCLQFFLNAAFFLISWNHAMLHMNEINVYIVYKQ